MGISIREPRDSDFFPWLGLYEELAASRGVPLTDLIALQVWNWLTEEARIERGLIAVDDEGALVGLVHFHHEPRPLHGELALQIDDLYVVDDRRGEGTGRALLDAAVAQAEGTGIRTVQWVDHVNSEESRATAEAEGDASNAVLYYLRRRDG